VLKSKQSRSIDSKVAKCGVALETGEKRRRAQSVAKGFPTDVPNRQLKVFPTDEMQRMRVDASPRLLLPLV
jgi:hypothetical protein